MSTIMQRRITQTTDFYSAMAELWRPNRKYFSETLEWQSDVRRDKFARTVLLRAMQRNSTHIYRITENRADVVDGKMRKGFIEEYVWRIAMRKQLGLGLMGCGSRPEVRAGFCQCNHTGARAGQPFEAETDQHFAHGGCSWAQGHRSERHAAVQRAMYRLQRYAAAGRPRSYLVTDHDVRPEERRRDSPRNSTDKYMDTIVEFGDDRLDKHVWVDFTIFDSLGKTMQKRGTGTPRGGRSVELDAEDVLRQAYNQKRREKAEVYAKEATKRGALLMTFCVDAHGGFKRRDPDFDPPVGPSAAGKKVHDSTSPPALFDKLFGSKTPPGRGKTNLSVEEGLIIRLAGMATNPMRAASIGLFDRTLAPSTAQGMLTAQVYRQIAYACIVHGALGSSKALRRFRRSVAVG